MSDEGRYRMPRSVPVPNVGRLVAPPPPGSRLWRAMDAFSGTNVALYRLSGGRIGGRMAGAPLLLLHHVGRKSGTKRITPVIFLVDGDRLVVVGSKGGAARDPAWVLNLAARPDTMVEVARERIAVRARPASDAERERLWPKLVELYPSFATYQGRTDRSLPVLVLEPR